MMRWVRVAVWLACAGAAAGLRAQAVTVVGSEEMQGALAGWNRLFARSHPEVRFRMILKGSASGISGLTAGVSGFAPMSREASEVDLRPFRFVYGYLPADIAVGRCGYAGPGRTSPPGVYVNRRNPLRGLTAADVARIFTAGRPEGDLTEWGQLGVGGSFAGRAMHVYGLRDDGGFASYFRVGHMGDHAYTPRYEPMADAAAVLRAVAEDPYGIGLVGEFEARRAPAAVRMLPLAVAAGGAFSAAGREDVERGLYPFSPYLHIYVNHAPNVPVAGWLVEYLRLALSAEGQRVLGEDRAACGVPLGAAEIKEQLRKVEALGR